MNADLLHLKVTIALKQLAAAVAAVTPPGIEHSPEARAMTAGADADVLIAATAFEADPNDRTRDRLKAAYVGALNSWRAAAARYEPLRLTGSPAAGSRQPQRADGSRRGARGAGSGPSGEA